MFAKKSPNSVNMCNIYVTLNQLDCLFVDFTLLFKNSESAVTVSKLPSKTRILDGEVRKNISELELSRNNNLFVSDVISRNFNTIFLWVFLRHIIKDHELETRVNSLLESFGAVDKANHLDQIVASNMPKEVFVREICEFYGFSTDRISFKYAKGSI